MVFQLKKSGISVDFVCVCVCVIGILSIFLSVHFNFLKSYYRVMGFPDSSVGKESTCHAEDPGLIPGFGRPTGEGKGYPLQYSWASLWLSW